MNTNVFFSAGHYKKAQGYVSDRYDVSEFELASRIVYHIRRNNMLRDISVVPYVILEEKIAFINKNAQPSDVAIEIHFNASEQLTAHGIETLHYPRSEKGNLLAASVQSTLVTYLPFSDRGIKQRGNLYFLNATKIPAIIAEILFLSNDVEAHFITYSRSIDVIANALVDGLHNYMRGIVPKYVY